MNSYTNFEELFGSHYYIQENQLIIKLLVSISKFWQHKMATLFASLLLCLREPHKNIVVT